MMDSIFGKHIIYRRYDVQNANITGDLLRRYYTDIPIVAEVQIQGDSDDLVKFGHLKIGDAEAFFSGRYKYDSDGNKLNPPLEIKNRDEILFNNKWYRIKSNIPEYFTEDNVIMYDCMMVMIEDEVENKPLEREAIAAGPYVLVTDENKFITDNDNNFIEVVPNGII